MLIIYIPEEKVLWQADLLVIEAESGKIPADESNLSLLLRNINIINPNNENK